MRAILASRRKKRVVVVDESRTMQAVLEQFLSLRVGLDVVGFASDVETAVAMIARLRPDIVTIDFRTPYNVKVLLEKLVDFPGMHKILISANACADLNIVSTLKQLGADACLDKIKMSRDPVRFCAEMLAILAKAKRGTTSPLADENAAAGSIAPHSILANHYPVPLDEQARLERLAALNLANDDEDIQLDHLTAHLGRTTDFPTCLMTFIDREKQWIKSAYGFSRGSTPRALAFCNYTLCADDMFIVPNTTLDARFSSHSAVIGTPRIRTYVGHPITNRSGVRLGVICLLDTRPRRISAAITTNLRSICEIAAGIIDARATSLRKVA